MKLREQFDHWNQALILGTGSYEDQLARWQLYWLDSHELVTKAYMNKRQWNRYLELEAQLKYRLWGKEMHPIHGVDALMIRVELRRMRRMALRHYRPGAVGYPTPGGGQQ